MDVEFTQELLIKQEPFELDPPREEESRMALPIKDKYFLEERVKNEAFSDDLGQEDSNINLVSKEPPRKRQAINCQHCNQYFPGQQKLDRHLRIDHALKTQCPDCHKNVKDLDGHIKRRHAPKIHPCPECPSKLFSTTWERNLHVKNVHQTAPKEKDLCTVCNKWFANVDAHTYRIHSVKSFSCMFCNFKSPLRMDVVRHTDQVHEKLSVQCPKCQKEVFDLENHLKRHDRERFMCIKCGEKFGMKDEVYKHYRKIHRIRPNDVKAYAVEENNVFAEPISNNRIYINLREKKNMNFFKCKYCDYKSKNKSNVQKHEEGVHENRREKCTICGKMVKSLRPHIRFVHDKQTNYHCELCGLGTRNEHALQNHYKAIHSGVDFRSPCPICSKYIKHVDQHIENVHGTEPKEKNHHCQLCDYKTHDKSALSMHRKAVHLKIKGSCPICNKTVTMVKMSSHLKCHKERRYKCIPCDKVFRERRDIARHILYLHQNVRHTCPICKKSDVTDVKLHVKVIHEIDGFLHDTTATDKELISEISEKLKGRYFYTDNNDLESGGVLSNKVGNQYFTGKDQDLDNEEEIGQEKAFNESELTCDNGTSDNMDSPEESTFSNVGAINEDPYDHDDANPIEIASVRSIQDNSFINGVKEEDEEFDETVNNPLDPSTFCATVMLGTKRKIYKGLYEVREGIFYCVSCGADYQSDRGVRHHLDKTVCGLGESLPKGKRRQYKNLYHQINGTWICVTCGATYQSDMGIRHHLDKTVCGRGEGQPPGRRKSYLGLYLVRDGSWFCKACGAEYQSDRGIRNHLDKSESCSRRQSSQHQKLGQLFIKTESDGQLEQEGECILTEATTCIKEEFDINVENVVNSQVVNSQLTTAMFNQIATPNDHLISTDALDDEDPLVTSEC